MYMNHGNENVENVPSQVSPAAHKATTILTSMHRSMAPRNWGVDNCTLGTHI